MAIQAFPMDAPKTQSITPKFNKAALGPKQNEATTPQMHLRPKNEETVQTVHKQVRREEQRQTFVARQSRSERQSMGPRLG